MKNFYKFSCAFLFVLLLVSLAVTLITGATGKAPTAEKFGLVAVCICLFLLAAVTVICLFTSQVGGRAAYKVGFYILHAGIVALLVGFLLSELTVTKSYFTFPVGHSYDRLEMTDGKSLVFDGSGSIFSLDELRREDYPDGSPKHYEATLGFYERSSGIMKRKESLTVNHPLRIGGYKVYLMDMSGDRTSATLLFKYDRGEYIILSGIAVLLCGTFLMCFSGLPKRRRGETE